MKKLYNITLLILLACTAASAQVHLPQYWTQERDSGNPLITVSSGDKAIEQYKPAPVLINGDEYIYVKGTAKIYLWKRVGGTGTPTIQNSGNPVIDLGTGGSWDDMFVVEPTAVYDAATSTVHIWYKGYDGATWQIGHATAPSSAPQTVTKDATNPILDPATVASALSIATPLDMAMDDVIKIGSTYYFFAFAATGFGTGNTYIFLCTGTDWNNPTPTNILLTAGPTDNVSAPSVFKHPDSPFYTMIYSDGSYLQTQNARDWRILKVAISTDLTSWQIVDDVLLWPQGGAGFGATGWESRQTYAARMLKKSADGYLEPEAIGGRYHLWYSGLSKDGPTIAQSGVLNLIPSLGHAPSILLPTTERDFPIVLFQNSQGVHSHGSISALDGTLGVDMVWGTNLFISKDASLQNFDTTKPYAAVYLNQSGNIDFNRRNGGGVNTMPLMRLQNRGVFINGNGTYGTNDAARLTLHNTVFNGGHAFHTGDTGTTQMATEAGLTLFTASQSGVFAFQPGTLITLGSGTATAIAGAATLNQQSGVIVSEALATPAGADYVLTLTNSFVSTSRKVFVSVDNGTNTTEGVAVTRVAEGAGLVTIRVRNFHPLSPLNGSIRIKFTVF